MRYILRCLTLAFAVSLVSPGLFAQGIEKKDVELNLFVGGSWFSGNKFEIGFPQAVTPIQGEFKLNTALRGGARFGVFNSNRWGQEFFYSFDTNEARLLRMTTPRSERDLGVQVHNAGVSALYYLDGSEENTFRQFLSFGVGATIFRPTDEGKAIARDPLRGNLPGFDQTAELAFHYGFGMKGRSRGNFGFRMDVRGFVMRNPTFGLPRESNNPNTAVFPAGGAFHNLEASGGIVFYFGR